MNVTILSLGSRGDVQPYIALALALQHNGFSPRLAAPVNFESFIRGYGVAYAPIQVDAEEALRSREGRAWLASGNTRAFIRQLNVLMERNKPAVRDGCWEACQDADAIIATALTLGEGLTLSEKLRRPFLGSLTCPILPPSHAFPHLLVTTTNLRLGSLNHLTHVVFERALLVMREDLNRWRARLDLPPLTTPLSAWLQRNQVLTLHHYGEPLFPAPQDWKPNNVLTGPLFLPETESVSDPVLDEFLANGESPVFLGFGSMPVLDPAGIVQTAARVTGKLGVRAVIVAGCSELMAPAPSKDLLVVGSADHYHLFPRCQALVHHGGAGTTFMGLSCGKPALVFSVFADQPFWGERVKRAGAGTHYRFHEFSEDHLLAGLQYVLQPAIQRRAEHLGNQLQREAGAANSVAAIRRYLKGGSAAERIVAT
jgi:sterol 3beta-glucosyltransferase